MTENSWPVETPQIDIAYKRGKWPSYFFQDKSLSGPWNFGAKGILGKQNSLWMDLEVSKVSNVKRKVIFLFLKESKPLRKLTSFFIYWICNS